MNTVNNVIAHTCKQTSNWSQHTIGSPRHMEPHHVTHMLCPVVRWCKCYDAGVIENCVIVDRVKERAGIERAAAWYRTEVSTDVPLYCSFHDWVLSHWAHFTVRRFICVYLCVFCVVLFRTAWLLYYCEHGRVNLMGLKSSP